MNSIDLGMIPTEPMATVLDRFAREHFASDAEPVNFATTHEQMMDIPGYMEGGTFMPHVVAGGVEWFPNAFLARIRFAEQNRNIPAIEMSSMSKDEQRVIAGFMFYRFVRTVK